MPVPGGVEVPHALGLLTAGRSAWNSARVHQGGLAVVSVYEVDGNKPPGPAISRSSFPR